MTEKLKRVMEKSDMTQAVAHLLVVEHETVLAVDMVDKHRLSFGQGQQFVVQLRGKPYKTRCYMFAYSERVQGGTYLLNVLGMQHSSCLTSAHNHDDTMNSIGWSMAPEVHDGQSLYLYVFNSETGENELWRACVNVLGDYSQVVTFGLTEQYK